MHSFQKSFFPNINGNNGHWLSPSRMIFLIHPDSTFFEWPNVLSEYSELDNAGSDSSGVCGNDDVPFPFLGRGHSYDLPVSFPLRYQQTVAAIDEDSNLSV